MDELRRQYGERASQWRLVQRLDHNGIGGVLVAANTNSARKFQKGGNNGFQLRTRYLAITEESTKSTETKSQGVIKGQGMTSSYRRVDERYFVIELITGRKYQIRKHLAHTMGQPIVNDVRYGALDHPNTEQIYLHSALVTTKVGLKSLQHLIPVGSTRNFHGQLSTLMKMEIFVKIFVIYYVQLGRIYYSKLLFKILKDI